MPEFSDLISQVSDNKILTEDEEVKKETLQILNDAKGIIDLAKGQGKDKEQEIRKEYENVRQSIIDATKEDLKITRSELDGLKAQVEASNDKSANFYENNQDMLNLETNRNIILKSLKLIVENKIGNINNLSDTKQLTVGLNDINKTFRGDLEVLKATRSEQIGFTTDDIQQMPNDFFKKEKNVEYLLKHSSEKGLIVLITSKNMSQNQLITLIGKINTEAVVDGEKILDKHIPKEILENDKENNLKLNESGKIDHLKKIEEITKDSMDKLISENKTDDIAKEIEYYLYKYKITDLSDETVKKILSITVDDDTLKYAPKFIFSLKEKNNIVTDIIKNNDENIVKNLPSEILKNNEIQKSIIDKIVINSKNNKSNDSLLNYLDFDDKEITKYFYSEVKKLGEIKSCEIFSNLELRENIRRIIGNNENTNDGTINDMVKDFSVIENGGRELNNAVKENKANYDKMEENDKSKFSEKLKGMFGLTENIEEVNKIIDEIISLKDNTLGSIVSEKLYNKILKLCRNDKKIAKLFIIEVKVYKKEKLELDNDNKIKELKDKKFDKFNIPLDNIKNNFEEFLANKIRELKDKNKDKPIDIEAISRQAVEEYIEKNQKDGITKEEKDIIRNILKNTVTIRKTESEIKNIDSYVKTMTGEMKKEEYNKVIQQSLEKNYLYNTKSDTFIPTEDDYSKVDGGYNLIGKNGEPIKGLVISEQEKKITLGNPEATKNLINFYDFFKELNLEGVWKYRNELMIAIGDINIDPNDADSMKTEELRKFGNKILTFVANVGKEDKEGKNEKVNLSSIQSVNQELQKFSGTNSPLNDKKTFNSYGEDRFTAFLRQQGIIGGASFKINEFRKYL